MSSLTTIDTVTTIEFTLPISLANDPRWRHFAETGIVGARWQGDELVLQGIPPIADTNRQQYLHEWWEW
jgi:hypothetical protein